MTQYLIGFIAGFATTALILVVEHVLFESTSRQARYVLGTAAICTGCSVAGLVLNDPALVVMPWAIAFAGVVILAIYWFEAQAEAKRRAAQKNGEIVGAARGLAKELVEDAESRLDQTRRRN